MRRAIYISVQFLNITKSWCFPIPCFLIVTPLTQNLSRKIVSYTSRTNGNKSIKITICRNFEANILTSKYKFHKFWNFNPSCDRTIVKIGEKRPKFAYLVQKVTAGCQNETKLIYQIQFVAEISKPDLYRHLKGMILIFLEINIFTASCT